MKLTQRLEPLGLTCLGGFAARADDDLPEGARAVLLLGPREPDFWQIFTQSPEWQAGAPDPMDRWSRRVIDALARDLEGTALFPFGGPPYHPFQSWALRAGTCWQSPVSLLVHQTAGLWVSFRGALALPDMPRNLPEPEPNPCETCAKPCLTACPASALAGTGYDVPACHAYLDSPEGKDDLTLGCAVRRACPVSQSYGRVAQQAAYHMSQFHKGRS